MLSSISFFISSLGSALSNFLNIPINLTGTTYITLRSIIIFVWVLWFVKQVIHLGIHLHTADQKGFGGKYDK